MWLPPWKYSPMTTLLPEPMVISDSSTVWRIAMSHLFTSRSSVMTSSCTGAWSCETISAGIGCVSAWASFLARSVPSVQPK